MWDDWVLMSLYSDHSAEALHAMTQNLTQHGMFLGHGKYAILKHFPQPFTNRLLLIVGLWISGMGFYRTMINIGRCSDMLSL